MELRGALGVELRKAREHRVSAELVIFRAQLIAQGVVRCIIGKIEPGDERVYIQPRAADDYRQAAAGDDIIAAARGFLDIARDRPALGRVGNIEHMVDSGGALLFCRLGSADVHAAVYLHGVRRDDLPVKCLRKLYAEACFAGGRRPRDNDYPVIHRPSHYALEEPVKVAPRHGDGYRPAMRAVFYLPGEHRGHKRFKLLHIRVPPGLDGGLAGDSVENLITRGIGVWSLAAVLTVLFLLFQRDLLRLFGASADTLPYAMQYLSIYVLGTVFVMTALGLNGFITAQGRSSVAMKTVVIGAILNVLLDPLFIFVLGLGVRGAAVATVLSQAVSAAWVLKFLTGKSTVLRLRRTTLRIDRRLLTPALALGASPFVMMSTESLLTVAFNVSLQKYGGDLAVGAMTILTSVAQMIQLPLTGLAQGAQPILSYNFGAHRPDRMKQVVRCNIALAVVFAASIWGIVQLTPHAVVHLFTSDTSLTDMTVWALRIYMALGFTNAFQTGFQQSFVALGEAKISLFLALERKVFLLIPLIFILPRFFENKLFAVFLAEPVADVLAAATTTVLFLIRFRKITNEM